MQTGSALSEKTRSRVNHSLDTYSYLNYIAFAIYPPLYIAGPIMTFNDFMWQVSLSRAPYTGWWLTGYSCSYGDPFRSVGRLYFAT